MNPDKRIKPTLEDLLRLKRAERPAEEFWAQFESDLRAKQLAAIVARRPWWHEFGRVFQPVVRHHVPVGAFAILLLTVVGVRQSGLLGTKTPATFRAPVSVSAAPSAPVETAATLDNRRDTRAETVAENLGVVSHVVAVPAPAASEPAVIREAQKTASVESSAKPNSSGLSGDVSSDEIDSKPFTSQDFGANFAGATLASTEPLTRINPVIEERRSRLLETAMPPARAVEAVASSDRAVSHMSEERLYESISRYGASGDRFSIKF